MVIFTILLYLNLQLTFSIVQTIYIKGSKLSVILTIGYQIRQSYMYVVIERSL